jgi:hypothetical protein
MTGISQPESGKTRYRVAVYKAITRSDATKRTPLRHSFSHRRHYASEEEEA